MMSKILMLLVLPWLIYGSAPSDPFGKHFPLPDFAPYSTLEECDAAIVQKYSQAEQYEQEMECRQDDLWQLQVYFEQKRLRDQR
jgi:hypothetical protein